MLLPPGTSKEEVLKELREAIQVYGVNGMTPAEIESWKAKFNKENPNGVAIADF